jgi:UDP-glucose 4-epimerase
MSPAEPFSGKRVLITGGVGFLGSSLARELVDAGARVVLVDSLVPEYGGNPANLAGIEDRVTVNISDVRDQHSLAPLLRGQDVLFNLAGQTSHLDSMTDPFTDLEINCRSQLSILEACRRHNPDVKIVFASTRQIYGRPRYLPVDEEHPVAPVDVNGITKYATEQLHLLYHDVYGLAASAVRLTNVFGPRQRLRDDLQGFLPIFLRRALTDDAIPVFGDGAQERDCLYVDDVVECLLLTAAVPDAAGEIFNVGNDERLSLGAIAAAVVTAAGTGRVEHVPWPPDRDAIDIGSYFGDSSKAKRTLGWEPRTSFAAGIERTVAFYTERRPWYL